MKKTLFISLVMFAFWGVFLVQSVSAANVWGWAWSENIGWISFSNSSGGGPVPYGVTIDNSTGVFSGYAWSENIGWISFNSADLASCPSGTCEAKANLITYEISGWARALSNGNGWDGWIRLNGVSIDFTVNPAEFRNWAWGDNVVGWVSFNGDNQAGGADYGVMTDLDSNGSPTANISCVPASCEVYQGEVLTLNNNSTDPDGAADIAQSQWWTKPSAGTYSLQNTCSTPPILCNYTPSFEIGSYTAKLRVTDVSSSFDEDEQIFAIKQDISVGFRCSMDNIDWSVDCEDIAPINGQTVYFKDNNSLTEYSIASEGSSINSRTWEGDSGSGWAPFSIGNNTNPSIIFVSPQMQIRLTVNDTAGRGPEPVTHIISGSMPLPTWKEVKP